MSRLEKVSSLVIKGLIYEVSISPKPGLVDRYTNGAHTDMDFYTFVDSSFALVDYFTKLAEIGYGFKGGDLRLLFDSIREPGKKAEEAMFTATKGVNTHKGLIFSLGVIACASGVLLKKGVDLSPLNITETCKQMLNGLIEKDFGGVTLDNAKTNGEKLFAKYNVTGIRGEAASGFETVIEKVLPVFKLNLASKNFNTAAVYALMESISVLDDTNILARSGFEALEYVKGQANSILKTHWDSDKVFMEKVSEMDRDLIDMHISPGGSADLLAIAIVLYFLENEFSVSQ